jgi:hypothetical protein
MELMQSSRNRKGGDEQDSSISKLLRENSSIAASMKSINEVLRLVGLCFVLSIELLTVNLL